MADVNDGDVLRVAGVMLLDNVHEITNVWHLLVNSGGPVSFATATPDIQEYMDLMFDDLDTRLCNNQEVSHLSVQNVTTDEVFGSIDWGVFAAGGSAADHVALGICVFAWGRTRKPRVQIRKYLGVFTETDIIDGVWQPALLGDVNTMMALHITNQVMTAGLQLQGVAFNRGTKVHTLATSNESAAEPAYQRRRRRGRGS